MTTGSRKVTAFSYSQQDAQKAADALLLGAADGPRQALQSVTARKRPQGDA